jgi:hypothetical protein
MKIRAEFQIIDLLFRYTISDEECSGQTEQPLTGNKFDNEKCYNVKNNITGLSIVIPANPSQSISIISIPFL